MLGRKVVGRVARCKSGTTYDHYVALEWSQKIMAIGHLSDKDAKPRIFERPAELRLFKEYLSSLKGSVIITFEESGSAQWLYLELSDYADRLLICEPFRNRLLCHGPKTDKIDAGKLCELLRAGLLKEVYHSDSKLYDIRKLVSAYDDVVRAGVRVMNQRASLALGHRTEGAAASFIEQGLQESIVLYQQQKALYEKQFMRIMRQNRLVRHQMGIPGIGKIGAVKIVATVVDARRFPSVGKFFSYCGLVRHEKLSGGQSYGWRRSRYNRTLKSVYKTAAMAILRMDNPIREYYDSLRARGVADYHARHAIARYIARVSYGMLKNGERYIPRSQNPRKQEVAPVIR